MAVLTEPVLPAQVAVRGEPLPGFPVEPNTTADVGGAEVLWLGPDEWLVLGATEADFADAAAAVDVSANRVAFELAGDDVAEVLARGCALDLDSFVPGGCAQTLLGRAQVILHRRDAATWRILVRPSFAPYLRAWLADALSVATAADGVLRGATPDPDALRRPPERPSVPAEPVDDLSQS